MAIEHVNIPDGERHEPKGADSASQGEVYISDGAGSGSWGNLDRVIYMVVEIDDISTASSKYVPLPSNCTVNSFKTVLHGTIATANSVITLSRGGDDAVLGTITVDFSGSGEGDIDNNSSLSNNEVTTGSHGYLKLSTNGASSNSVGVTAYIQLTIAG